MGRMSLSLDTLKDFDFGKAEIAFRKVLETVVLDCSNRGYDKKARKVLLSLVMEPIVEGDGAITDANIHFTVQAKLPALQTAPRPVLMDRQGRLVFNSDAPDNPRQQTLDQEYD